MWQKEILKNLSTLSGTLHSFYNGFGGIRLLSWVPFMECFTWEEWEKQFEIEGEHSRETLSEQDLCLEKS